MTTNKNQKTAQPMNYLVSQKAPPITNQTMYSKQESPRTDFGYVWGPQSHLTRRKKILQAHPQIAKLLVPTKPYTVIIATVLVCINLTLAYFMNDASWPVFLLTVYIVGGMIGHTCHVLVHDFTHYSGHQNVLVNKAFAIFCNLTTGIPSAISFGRYHSDHHNFFSEYGKDYDLPTMVEVRSFKSTIGKFFFFFFLTPIYALRPFIFMHKKMTLDEIINFAVILCSDVLIYKFWGGGSLAYILLTAFFSIGGHPAAIHTIAEHAEFVTGMESYDYFGIWNFFNLNLGHHIEHHDFPTCPWYNLPAIRAAAPEWYQYLPHHTSYLKVLWKFVTDQNFSLFNRTLRLPEKKAE